MSAEENKANQLRVWEEAFGKGNLDVIDELFAPSYYFKSPLGMEIKGSEGFKENLAMMRSAFPDFHLAIEDQIAEEDKVVTRLMATGTYQGGIADIPATAEIGAQVAVSEILIHRVSAGRVVEGWIVGDELGLWQQLGVIPPLGEGEG